jgi:mRNA interferase MazF
MNRPIRRGEIWWVSLDPARGSEIRKTRPCVVLSADEINRRRRTPVVVPLSSAPDDAPPVVISVPSAGRESVAIVDQIRAVDKSRFVRTSGRLSSEDMALIESALGRILEMPD